MDRQIQKIRPDYKRIYSDILSRNFPHKKEECKMLLAKGSLSVLDVIELNNRIFGTADKQSSKFNQRHRSYSKTDIRQILEYQEKNNLNNSQLAIHFRLSRNTVAKWKKMFLV